MKWISCLLLTLLFSGCATDYENNYRMPRRMGQGVVAGGMAGALVGKFSAIYSNPAAVWDPGIITGAVAGFALQTDFVRMYRLSEIGVKVVEYGDNITVVLPSDYFFDVDTGKLRYEREYTLLEVASLISKYPASPVTILAFSDSVGSDQHARQLTQKQSHSILSFLWSHGVDQRRLHAFCYGKAPTIADNRTVLGNGLNRRVEIHWRKLT